MAKVKAEKKKKSVNKTSSKKSKTNDKPKQVEKKVRSHKSKSANKERLTIYESLTKYFKERPLAKYSLMGLFFGLVMFGAIFGITQYNANRAQADVAENPFVGDIANCYVGTALAIGYENKPKNWTEQEIENAEDLQDDEVRISYKEEFFQAVPSEEITTYTMYNDNDGFEDDKPGLVDDANGEQVQSGWVRNSLASEGFVTPGTDLKFVAYYTNYTDGIIDAVNPLYVENTYVFLEEKCATIEPDEREICESMGVTESDDRHLTMIGAPTTGFSPESPYDVYESESVDFIINNTEQTRRGRYYKHPERIDLTSDQKKVEHREVMNFTVPFPAKIVSRTVDTSNLPEITIRVTVANETGFGQDPQNVTLTQPGFLGESDIVEPVGLEAADADREGGKDGYYWETDVEFVFTLDEIPTGDFTIPPTVLEWKGPDTPDPERPDWNIFNVNLTSQNSNGVGSYDDAPIMVERSSNGNAGSPNNQTSWRGGNRVGIIPYKQYSEGDDVNVGDPNIEHEKQVWSNEINDWTNQEQTVSPEEIVKYRINVTSSGEGVIVVDDLDDVIEGEIFDFESITVDESTLPEGASWNKVDNGDSVTIEFTDLGELNADEGESLSLEYQAQVKDADDLPIGEERCSENVVTVRGGGDDLTDKIRVCVEEDLELEYIKEVWNQELGEDGEWTTDDQTVNPGEEVKYRIRVNAIRADGNDDSSDDGEDDEGEPEEPGDGEETVQETTYATLTTRKEQDGSNVLYTYTITAKDSVEDRTLNEFTIQREWLDSMEPDLASAAVVEGNPGSVTTDSDDSGDNLETQIVWSADPGLAAGESTVITMQATDNSQSGNSNGINLVLAQAEEEEEIPSDEIAVPDLDDIIEGEIFDFDSITVDESTLPEGASWDKIESEDSQVIIEFTNLGTLKAGESLSLEYSAVVLPAEVLPKDDPDKCATNEVSVKDAGKVTDKIKVCVELGEYDFIKKHDDGNVTDPDDINWIRDPVARDPGDKVYYQIEIYNPNTEGEGEIDDDLVDTYPNIFDETGPTNIHLINVDGEREEVGEIQGETIVWPTAGRTVGPDQVIFARFEGTIRDTIIEDGIPDDDECPGSVGNYPDKYTNVAELGGLISLVNECLPNPGDFEFLKTHDDGEVSDPNNINWVTYDVDREPGDTVYYNIQVKATGENEVELPTDVIDMVPAIFDDRPTNINQEGQLVSGEDYSGEARPSGEAQYEWVITWPVQGRVLQPGEVLELRYQGVVREIEGIPEPLAEDCDIPPATYPNRYRNIAIFNGLEDFVDECVNMGGEFEMVKEHDDGSGSVYQWTRRPISRDPGDIVHYRIVLRHISGGTVVFEDDVEDTYPDIFDVQGPFNINYEGQVYGRKIVWPMQGRKLEPGEQIELRFDGKIRGSIMEDGVPQSGECPPSNVGHPDKYTNEARMGNLTSEVDECLPREDIDTPQSGGIIGTIFVGMISALIMAGGYMYYKKTRSDMQV